MKTVLNSSKRMDFLKDDKHGLFISTCCNLCTYEGMDLLSFKPFMHWFKETLETSEVNWMSICEEIKTFLLRLT